MSGVRTRADRCPGVLRPWAADDGALARVRLVGGAITGDQLRGLSEVSQRYGDGDLYLTSRANLQVRALPATGGDLEPDVVDAIEALGLLPSRAHDQVRNVMLSPLTGVIGGRADLRPVAREVDRLLLADPRLAALPGKFLFVLDDGRGDLVARDADLLAVALGPTSAQVRVGETWGEQVSLANAGRLLVELARAFLASRGDGPDAPWHVTELAEGTILMPAYDPDPRVPAPADPPAYDERHVAVPLGVLTPAQVGPLAVHDRLVVTPWNGVLIP